MADRKVRIGIIGVGQIGKAHLETYAKVPEAQVVAAADTNEPELARVADKYAIPWSATSFRDLLARPDVEAVDVCLHNNLHAPVTIAALEAGKHVYCEKPMAGSYADAKAMADAAARTGRRLAIQLSTLFSRETKAAKRLIDDGRLGRLYHARSTGFRRRGRPFVDGYGTAHFVQKKTAAGGALYDMGVYHIAQLLHLLGRPKVERIAGKIYQEMDMDAARRQSSGFDVEELGLGLVRFEGGLTMDIIEAWAIHLGGFDSGWIVGSQGGIRLQPFCFHTTTADLELDASVNLDAADTRWHRLRPEESAYDGPQQHWVAALLGRVPLLETAEIALATMLVSEGIYLSDRLGREVTAEEVAAASRSTAVSV
jgi:predicted dehydrogenase